MSKWGSQIWDSCITIPLTPIPRTQYNREVNYKIISTKIGVCQERYQSHNLWHVCTHKEGCALIDSSLVRKMEKAKDYAVQADRVKLNSCSIKFRGDHSDHDVTYEAESWRCTCEYFSGHGTCSHTMAVEMKLEGVI